MDIDFGKALNLLDVAFEQLSKHRSNPQKNIHAVEENFNEIEWEEKRISRRRRRMPGELAQDEPATSAEEKWRGEVFYGKFVKHAKLICIAVLLNFTVSQKHSNFDTVENKTDHADYGDVSDQFSYSTEDTYDE